VSDKRKHNRVMTLQSGAVHFKDDASPIKCAILNISEGGACLLVASTAYIPDAFELAIDFSGRKHACRVAWKTSTKLGVLFREVALVD
jgi:hypothetical protein